jgi:hypothetical protein
MRDKSRIGAADFIWTLEAQDALTLPELFAE